MIRSMTAIAVLTCLTPSLPARAGEPASSAPAVKPNAKLDDIRKLLELTGSAQLGRQVMDQLIPAFKQSTPNAPAQFWEDFRKEARPEELVAQLVLIYDKHLTHQEVKEIIAFYETPAGRKLVAVLPMVTQESMVAGQAWGRALAEKVSLKLKDKEGASGAK